MQRQIIIMSILIAACVAMFVFTRDMSVRLDAAKAQDAATWYVEGQQLLLGAEFDEAVDAFRSATVAQVDNLDYSLGLAEALVAAERNDEARGLLLKLRAVTPETAAVNSYLARVEADGGAVDEAVRYYRSALQGIWPAGQEDARRMLRVELIRFQLKHGDREGALFEILILSANSPGGLFGILVGQLFLDAGSAQEALESFEQVISDEPENGPALAGAGEALFELEDYARARRFLASAVDHDAASERVAERLEVATFVLSTDPTAPRLSTAERQRRLQVGLDRVIERLQACVESATEPAALMEMLDEVNTMRTELRPGSVGREPDLPDIGLALIGRAETAAAPCAEATALDQALVLIEQRRRAGEL